MMASINALIEQGTGRSAGFFFPDQYSSGNIQLMQS
jgi:hypothetical protein